MVASDGMKDKKPSYINQLLYLLAIEILYIEIHIKEISVWRGNEFYT